MQLILRDQFIWEFTRIGKIPAIYKSLCYNDTNFANKACATTNTANVISMTLFPTFLTPNLVNEENYQLKKINHRNFSGAGVAITNPESVEAFLSKNLKTQIRKNLRRTISRLEESFNISYVYYYGSITQETFEFLLNHLKNLLEKRFGQKNMVNNFLSKWNNNVNGLFELINKKKASLFVVYDEAKPISISVNRHFENTMLFSECNGYDLDYSKFGLGHLDNYLLVKWCIENKYSFLDLGNGVVEYKKRWCNVYYDFEYHVYYKKKSLSAKVIASIEVNKIKMKNLIKQYKVDAFFKSIKDAIKSPSAPSKQTNISFSVNVIDGLSTYDETKLKKLNINLPETAPIRQPIYDYLYLNKIHIDNIIIYDVMDKLNTFLFQSPKETLEIILTHED